MIEQVGVQNEIDITQKAIEQILRIKEENNIPSEYALRIEVNGGSCSGMTYQLGFDGEAKDGDTVIEKDNIKILIDGKSLFYLAGAVLDFNDGLNDKGFIINNPKAVKTCGCNDSCGA